MPSPLQQLENNEAVLLMYAADELPPEDRAEVEQMLAVDIGMRAELESIRANLTAVEHSIGNLDAITRLPMTTAVALRRLAPALAEWQRQRLAPLPPAAPAANLRYAWWVYPTASAAAILLAAVVWWGYRGDDTNSGASFATHQDEQQVAPDSFADRDGHVHGPFDPSYFRGPNGLGGPGVLQVDAPDSELSDAEQQVASLSHGGNDEASTSSIFMIDGPTD